MILLSIRLQILFQKSVSYAFLSNTFNIQINHTHRTGLAEVNAVDAAKGIDDWLTAVGAYGIAETLGNDFHGHTRFNANAIGLEAPLGGDSEFGHFEYGL